MLKVVMIDDSVMCHRMLQLMVQKYQDTATVTYSLDAKNIIDFLESHQQDTDHLPDVILLDLCMPGFNGYDFLVSYNKLCHQINKHIDIYIVSSSVDPDDVKLHHIYPFIKQYLIKPLTLANVKGIFQAA